MFASCACPAEKLSMSASDLPMSVEVTALVALVYREASLLRRARTDHRLTATRRVRRGLHDSKATKCDSPWRPCGDVSSRARAVGLGLPRIGPLADGTRPARAVP